MFGLINLEGSGELSLKSVDISCSIYNLLVGCNGTLVYRNETRKNAEGLFIFPREDDWEMTFIKADVGARALLGRWMDKKAAKAIASNTTDSGPKLVFLQFDKEPMSLIKFRIGLIPAGSEVKVFVKFIMELKLGPTTNTDVEQYSLKLPVILMPRLTRFGGAKDGQMYYINMKYNYAFNATFSGTKEIRCVYSLNHTLSFNSEGVQGNCAKVCLQSLYDGTKDFDININYVRSNTVSIILTLGTKGRKLTDNDVKEDLFKSNVAVLNYIPSIHLNKVEFVFVVDISDSFNIQKVKECLQIFMAALPAHSMPRIYGFGSCYEIESQLNSGYHTDSKVNYNGTDFMHPLINMYSQLPHPGHRRIVFILTDGYLSNKDEVLQLIEDNNKTTTLHSICIGPLTSRAFSRQMAKAGRGKSLNVTDYGDLCSTFTDLFQSAIQINEFIIEQVDWQCPNNVTVSTIPSMPRVVPPNQCINIFCVTTGLREGDTIRGTLRVKVNGEENHLVANIVYKNGVYDDNFTAHRVMAKHQIHKLITEIDRGNLAMKNTLKKLGNQSNIETKYSVLVAVDQKDPKRGLIVNQYETNESDELEVADLITDSSAEIPAVYISSTNDPLNKMEETVTKIIQKQNIDGSWLFDPTLINDLGSDPVDVTNNQPVGLTSEAWMTTFIHSAYATKVRDRELEWCLSDDKAKRYIVNYLNQSPIMAEIKKGNAFKGTTDISEVIETLMEKAVEVLKEELTPKCIIVPKEVDDAIRKETSRKNTREIHFIMDQSGSMGGDKIKDARRCLEILVKGISVKCRFQIYGFGTDFDKAFRNGPLPYDNLSCDAAWNYITKMEANKGGTDLIKPLKDIYKLQLPRNIVRLIFAITDGCVDDLNGVVKLVKENNNHNKVFSVGIGNDVGKDLIQRLAEEGFGKFIFVKESKGLTANLNRLIKAALEVD